jgi:hypothetical protein
MMSGALEVVAERDEGRLRTHSGVRVNTRAEKLLRWFMFSVLVSLVPLALTYFNLWLDRREGHLEVLVARGELLLICTTLGASAIGELFPGNHDRGMAKLLIAGALILLILISSVCFASIQSRHSTDARSIFAVSLALFAGMLPVAASCVFYSHQEAR